VCFAVAYIIDITFIIILKICYLKYFPFVVISLFYDINVIDIIFWSSIQIFKIEYLYS